MASSKPFSKIKPAEKFLLKWISHGLSGGHPQLEYEFDEGGRKWRFDFCWPTERVAVEIDGLGYGHQAVVGMALDNEKANAAVRQGWRVFRYNSKQLGSHAAVEGAGEEVCAFLCQAKDVT